MCLFHYSPYFSLFLSPSPSLSLTLSPSLPLSLSLPLPLFVSSLPPMFCLYALDSGSLTKGNSDSKQWKRSNSGEENNLESLKFLASYRGICRLDFQSTGQKFNLPFHLCFSHRLINSQLPPFVSTCYFLSFRANFSFLAGNGRIFLLGNPYLLCQ